MKISDLRFLEHRGNVVWRFVLMCIPIFALIPSSAWSNYVQTNLVSDLPGVANITDPNLVNPWGISHSSSSPFWISDNGTDKSTVYNGSGQPFPLPPMMPLVVSIPNGVPTGQVFNDTNSFGLPTGGKALFLFASESGTISGWNSAQGSSATIQATTPGAVYKGLAIGNNGSGDFLYAANFAANKIDVFNGTFASVTLGGSFTDPNLPAEFAPFNIQNIGGKLYVTYAKVGMGGDDEAGPGNGFVDVYDLNGNFVNRLVSMGPLNSPWGLALAPGTFGQFGGDLLVGNFGDGTINAFNPMTGAFLGTLDDPKGDPIVNEGLWGLIFGNGGNGGNPNALYFTAGIPGPGEVEDHGLFGVIATAPEPDSVALIAMAFVALALLKIGKRSARHCGA